MVILALLLLGICLSGSWTPQPLPSVRMKFQRLAQDIEKWSGTRKESAKAWVSRINGHSRESMAARSWNDARTVYETIGQPGRYGAVLQISLLAALAGAAAGGVLLHSLPLAVVLGVGFYYLPLWLSQFRLYRYDAFVSEELEVALGMITTSYNRSGDILGAVEENLSHIKPPVRDVFSEFVWRIRYVDANAPAQIERMKAQLNNKLFSQWCDILILCQDNHTLQAALIPVVNKFSDLKAQRQENATNMMLPLRRAVTMIALTLGVIPLLAILDQDIYGNLVNTPFGQGAMAATAVVVFITINKAIGLCKPVTYDV